MGEDEKEGGRKRSRKEEGKEERATAGEEEDFDNGVTWPLTALTPLQLKRCILFKTYS